MWKERGCRLCERMLGLYGGAAPGGRWKKTWQNMRVSKTWQNMRVSKVDCLGTATIG